MSDRDLDRRVAEVVMGLLWRKPTHGTCCTCQTCGHDIEDCACGWSEDVEKSHRVIDRMGELGWYFKCWGPNPVIEVWAVVFYGDDTESRGNGDTFAAAVCKAALAALEAAP